MKFTFFKFLSHSKQQYKISVEVVECLNLMQVHFNAAILPI